MSVSEAEEPGRPSRPITNTPLGERKREDLDIYSDILTDQDEHITKLSKLVEKLTTEKGLLLKSSSSLQENYEKLLKEFKDLEAKYNQIKFNSSALLKTAQAEIRRKDTVIAELRRKNDNLVFRKTSNASGRDKVRRVTAEPRRPHRSPLKRRRSLIRTRKHEDSQDTKSNHEESCDPNPKYEQKTDPNRKYEENPIQNQKHEENRVPSHKNEDISILKIEKEDEVPKDCGEKDPTLDYDSDSSIDLNKSINFEREDNVANNDKSMSSENCKIPSSPSKYDLGNNKDMVVLPPLEGPMTEFSKRQYKKIYGVSPQKVFIPEVEDDDMTLQIRGPSLQQLEMEKTPSVNTGSLVKTESEKEMKMQMEMESKTTAEHKSINVALKLKDTVKEIIKLGSTTPTNSTSHSKVSSEIKNTTPENGVRKHFTPTSTKLSPPNLVIQCDLRVNASEMQNSPNSVSVKETIGNLIKQHRSQLQISNIDKTSPTQNQSTSHNEISKDDVKDSIKEPLKMDSQSKKMSTKQNNINTPKGMLLIVNKKPLNKPIISPVTFGNLIPPEDQIRNNKISPGNLNIRNKDSVSSNKHKNAKLSAKKKKVFTSLFGDSPSKSCSSDSKVPSHELNKAGVDKSSSPSSTYSPLRTTSLIFPSSPSLDSDSNDLVIDTTACSQNQSPQVSSLKSQQSKSKHSIFDIVSKKEDPKLVNTSTIPHFDNQNEEVLKSVATNHNPSIKTYTQNPSSVEKIDSNEGKVIVGQDNENKERGNSLKIGLPDLAQCFSSDTHDHPLRQPSENNKIASKSDVLKDDTQKRSYNTSETPNGCNINSDPQRIADNGPLSMSSELTLLTVFKHSENSVLNMTEDTIGFVSALTRVRDISPIRTPNKKTKALNESKNTEFPNENQINKFMLESKISNANFVERNSQALPEKPVSTKNESESSNLRNIISMKEKVIEGTKNVMESECSKTVSKQLDCSARAKVYNTQTNVEHNVFRRSKPLKIQITNTFDTLATSEKENINIHTAPILATYPKNNSTENTTTNNPNVSQLAKRDRETNTSPKVEEKMPVSNVNNPNENKLNNSTKESETPLKEDEEQNTSILKVKNESNTLNEVASLKKTEPSKCFLKPQQSQLGSANNTRTHIAKDTFKRSNTLRTMKKPLPRVDYGVLTKDDNTKDNGRKCLKSSFHTNDLDQTAHIANINKKVRVSTFKRDCDQKNNITAVKSNSENLKECPAKSCIPENSEAFSKPTSVPKKEKKKTPTTKSNEGLSFLDNLLLTQSNSLQQMKPSIYTNTVETKPLNIINKSQKLILEEKVENNAISCPQNINCKGLTSKANDSHPETRKQEEIKPPRLEKNVCKEPKSKESLAKRSRNTSRSESCSPKPNRRSESLHSGKDDNRLYNSQPKTKKREEESPSRHQENISKCLNSKKVVSRRLRSESCSPEPNRRSKSLHTLHPKTRNQEEINSSRLGDNVVKELNNMKSMPRRSRNTSRSQSSSPEPNKRSKSLHVPKSSGDLFRAVNSSDKSIKESSSSRYDLKNNRSVEHRSRDRSPPRGRRYRRRSRSRSFEYRSRNNRTRDRSRNFRRSRDRSSWYDRRKRSRSSSPETHMPKSRKLGNEDSIHLAEKKSSEQFGKSEQPTSYCDELQTMKKELERVKKELELKNSQSPCQPSNTPSIDNNTKAHLMVNKCIISKNSGPSLEVSKSQTTKDNREVKPTESANTPPIVKQPLEVLRKRGRTLGDSDVKTVSFSRKT